MQSLPKCQQYSISLGHITTGFHAGGNVSRKAWEPFWVTRSAELQMCWSESMILTSSEKRLSYSKMGWMTEGSFEAYDTVAYT